MGAERCTIVHPVPTGCPCGDCVSPLETVLFEGVVAHSPAHSFRMNQKNRDYFDRQVERVLERLPPNVLDILQEVPIHVEDQPSESLMQELNIADPEELCAYFCGVPYGQPMGHEVHVPNHVTLFRRGIAAASRNARGNVCRHKLCREIRITILHELAHLHGMDEDEIADAGYA